MTLLQAGAAVATESVKVDGRPLGKLTPEKAIQALRDYREVFGEQPTTASFNPATARSRGRYDLVERYEAGNPKSEGERWPSLNAIKALFGGSFDAAMIAAGMTPARSGPKRHALIAAEVSLLDSTNPAEALAAAVQRAEAAEAALGRSERTVATLANQVERLEGQVERIRERRERGAAYASMLADARESAEKARAKTRQVRVQRDEAREQTRAAEAAVRVLERDRAGLERELEALRGRAPERVEVVREVTVEVERPVPAAVADDGSLREVQRELRSAKREAADATVKASVAKDGEQGALRAKRRAEARAQAAEEAAAAARETLASMRAEVLESAAVRVADARAEAAEARAAETERRMAEQGRAVLGEMRPLTPAELADLRSAGPAGPAVMADALRDLAKARGRASKGDLEAALRAVAVAAVTWRDRL